MEDLTVWQMEKVKQTRKDSRTYTYWMASWREGGKTRNVHLGSARKMDGEAARQKARERRRRRSMLIELTRGKHAVVDVNNADLVRSRIRQSPRKGIAGGSLKGVERGVAVSSQQVIVIVEKTHPRAAKVISRPSNLNMT